jgi:hypothetical protein
MAESSRHNVKYNGMERVKEKRAVIESPSKSVTSQEKDVDWMKDREAERKSESPNRKFFLSTRHRSPRLGRTIRDNYEQALEGRNLLTERIGQSKTFSVTFVVWSFLLLRFDPAELLETSMSFTVQTTLFLLPLGTPSIISIHSATNEERRFNDPLGVSSSLNPPPTPHAPRNDNRKVSIVSSSNPAISSKARHRTPYSSSSLYSHPSLGGSVDSLTPYQKAPGFTAAPVMDNKRQAIYSGSSARRSDISTTSTSILFEDVDLDPSNPITPPQITKPRKTYAHFNYAHSPEVSDSDSDGSPILPSATKSTPGVRDKERDGKHPLRNSVSASHLQRMTSGLKDVEERKILRFSAKERAKEKKAKEKKGKKGFEYVPIPFCLFPYLYHCPSGQKTQNPKQKLTFKNRLTPLSNLINQSFADIRTLREIHSNVVARAPEVAPIDFTKVEENLRKFEEYVATTNPTPPYASNLQPLGLTDVRRIYKSHLSSATTTPSHSPSPSLSEVHLVAMVCKKSDVVNGELSHDASVPLLKERERINFDCGF